MITSIQIGIAHKILVYFLGSLSALTDRPDYQRLSTVHIACGEHFIHAGAVVSDLCGNIGSRCHLHAECVCDIRLCAQETCGDQHQISVQNLLAARNLLHPHSAGLGIMHRLELDGLYCTDVVLDILDKPLYR